VIVCKQYQDKPMRNGDLRRRRFLQVAASGAAATVSCGGQKSRWRFFSNAEADTLAAICDQIIPPDQDPGASQAGVVQFIDRQLTGFHRKLRPQYRNGIRAINDLARKANGREFASLGAEAQLDVLNAIEQEKLGDRSVRTFFNTVVNHTMQGYYGSPRHGGNREWASWKMLGVPPVPVRGRQA
jgi:gluconate 2-dehydrogenase gamma chain